MIAAEDKCARCIITMLTETDKKKNVIVRFGEMRIKNDGEIILSYESEKDAGTLTVIENYATWRREGNMDAFLTFDAKKTTKGVFGSDGLDGEATIETQTVEVKIKKDVISAELEYKLKFDYGEQKMRVKINARLLKETSVIVS